MVLSLIISTAGLQAGVCLAEVLSNEITTVPNPSWLPSNNTIEIGCITMLGYLRCSPM